MFRPRAFAGERDPERDLRVLDRAGIGDSIVGQIDEGVQLVPVCRVEAIEEAVDGCLADDDCNAQLFAIQTCDALLQSGPFLFY